MNQRGPGQKWGVETHDELPFARPTTLRLPITVSEDASTDCTVVCRRHGVWSHDLGPRHCVVDRPADAVATKPFEPAGLTLAGKQAAVTLSRRLLASRSRSEFSFPAEQLASGRWLDCAVPFSKEAQPSGARPASVRDKLHWLKQTIRTEPLRRAVAIAEVAAWGSGTTTDSAPGQWRVSVTESGLAWSGAITLTSGENELCV